MPCRLLVAWLLPAATPSAAWGTAPCRQAAYGGSAGAAYPSSSSPLRLRSLLPLKLLLTGPVLCRLPGAWLGVVPRLSAASRCAVQRDASVTGADGSEALAELGAVLLGGLKALHVYSNTGQGRSMPDARGPVQAAWSARGELLTAAQQQQLEGFLSNSKNFAALLEQRSPSPQPVRREYVPAPRQQPQQKERKRQQESSEQEAEQEEEQPRLSKRQLKRLQAQQRAEAAAEAKAQQAVHAAQGVQLAAQQEQGRAAEEAEAAANKRYKLKIKLGATSLTGALPDAPQLPPPPSLPPAPAVALGADWPQHGQQRQQQQQQQQPWGGSTPALPPAGPPPLVAPPHAEPPLPPLPPEDVPGGWQSVGAPPPVAHGEWEGRAEPPLSPMSAPSSPRGMTAAEQQAGVANGSGALPQLGLNPAAVEHAANGSPAVEELLG